MDFTISDKQKRWRDRVAMFMAQHVYPAVPTYTEQMRNHRRQKNAGGLSPSSKN